jgi:hypothetical protein
MLGSWLRSVGLALGVLLAALATLGAREEGRAASPWIPIIDEDGIKVWRREVEGSPTVEFFAMARVQAPLVKTAAVLRDTDRMKEWMENCTGSATIEWTSPTRWIGYHRTKSPGLFVSDRDVVADNTLNVSPDRSSILIAFRNITDPRMPKVDGVVRMPALVGHWRLVAAGPDATDIEYQLHAEPGGSIPSTLVNWATERLPFKTIQGLRKQVRAPGYERQVEIVESVMQRGAGEGVD